MPSRSLPLPLAVLAVLLSACTTPRETPVALGSGDGVASFAEVAERVTPGVVSISAHQIAPVSRQAFPFGAPQPGIRRGTGSGFVISGDGFILTNYHVIENATRVEVRFPAIDSVRVARVVGRDPETDLALLKVDDAGDLVPLMLGDSDQVRPGDWAIAVGNPHDFANTVTVGVISAHGRALGLSEATAAFENFMQTDAAINPGNSGGPLLNARGQVIGINTAMRAYAQNIGFATPVNTAKRVIEILKRDGRVRRGYLGITVADIDERFREAFELPSRDGVLVQSVEQGSPADRAGIRRGDVVLVVNGAAIGEPRELIDAVAYAGPGKRLELRVQRDGKEQKLTATTAERVSAVPDAPVPEQASQTPSNRMGVAVQPLTPELRRQLNLTTAGAGIVVTGVQPGSPADEAGLSPGDVVVEANGKPMTTVEALRQIVESTRRGRYLRLYVVRPAADAQTVSFYVVVRM
ncbi:MAG TPA: trypsin-like peptidase domain-containing protein [Thermoanaerobaculia bacterium]|nr:trypsin-like peptidase domain-containing protein [Thermoanaerobaculia bacterium]